MARSLYPLSLGDSGACGSLRRRVGDGLWLFDSGTRVNSPHLVFHLLCRCWLYIDRSCNNSLNDIPCNPGCNGDFGSKYLVRGQLGFEDFGNEPSERPRGHDGAKDLNPDGSPAHHDGARDHDDGPPDRHRGLLAHYLQLRDHRDRRCGEDALSLYAGRWEELASVHERGRVRSHMAPAARERDAASRGRGPTRAARYRGRPGDL